jgi:4-hydroxybutyryl-CoA dehydratase / vinylacetyl-CoA-Delta-isomerase
MAIRTAAEYVESLRNRNLTVYLFGERVPEPVDHPVIRPSINAVAQTYALAEAQPELATAVSALTGEQVNRFLHVTTDVNDVVMQNRMQRRLGQQTGTCFQRCVGMDAINSMFSVTFDIDRAHGTSYHQRFIDFVKHMQRENFVVGGAMTDPKGDRGKAPPPAGRPRPLRARGRAARRRRRVAWRQGASDRLHQFSLAARHAHHAVG